MSKEASLDPPGRASWPRVARLRLRNFRNYERLDVALASGVTVVHGPVGAGKTNLLEGIYFGCVGRSPRTANERDLLRFGERSAHAAVTSVRGSLEWLLEAGLEVGRPKQLKVDGVAAPRSPSADERPLLCVFMPDRLELIKGPAAIRRTHLDAFIAAVWPVRRATRFAYGRALVQRNALLGRVRASRATRDSLSSWNRELARHGWSLMEDRSSAVELLSERFRTRAAELGLEGQATLRYRPRSSASTAGELEAEFTGVVDRDLERGFTTHGPHRDDVLTELAGRDLRRFGSQGQQRLGLLALLLAERDGLREKRGELPIMLLDDVLSELDTRRRARLLEVLGVEGQTLITTADLGAASAAGSGFARMAVAAGCVDG